MMHPTMYAPPTPADRPPNRSQTNLQGVGPENVGKLGVGPAAEPAGGSGRRGGPRLQLGEEEGDAGGVGRVPVWTRVGM